MRMRTLSDVQVSVSFSLTQLPRRLTVGLASEELGWLHSKFHSLLDKELVRQMNCVRGIPKARATWAFQADSGGPHPRAHACAHARLVYE